MRRLISALLAAMLLLGRAFAVDSGGVTVSAGMVTGLAGAAASAEEIVIPSECGGRDVEIIYRLRSESLKKVTLPPTVKTIYEGAFSGCPNLESINLENVTTIYAGAFEGCSALNDIGNGNRLLRGCYVGDRAFAATGLERLIVDVNLDPSSGGGGAFAACDRLFTVGVTGGVSVLGGGVFASCAALDQICLPHSIDRLSGGTFAGCSNLRTVVFPTKNIIFDDSEGPIFAGCPKLTMVGMAGTTAETYAAAHGIPFVPSIIPVTAASTLVAYADCTCTVTINGTDVPAYTVGNSVYVGENAMKCFGIACDWNRPTRSTLITVPEGTTFSVTLNTNPEPYSIGIFSSDTAFYLDGFRIPAFNVGNGESIVDVNALAGRVLY